jgi:hypothetical protein
VGRHERRPYDCLLILANVAFVVVVVLINADGNPLR